VGDDVGTVSVKAQEVVLIWDPAFFRARYSRCLLLISSLCSLDISACRFCCCMFLSSVFREALSSMVSVWTYIGYQYGIIKNAAYIHIESIPLMLVVSLSASCVSLGVDIVKYLRWQLSFYLEFFSELLYTSY